MFFPQLTEMTRESLERSSIQVVFLRLPGLLGNSVFEFQRKLGVDRELFSW
jgi:hypothetical protein